MDTPNTRPLTDVIEHELHQIIKFNRNREADRKDPYTIRSQAGIIAGAVERELSQRFATLGMLSIFPAKREDD